MRNIMISDIRTAAVGIDHIFWMLVLFSIRKHPPHCHPNMISFYVVVRSPTLPMFSRYCRLVFMQCR